MSALAILQYIANSLTLIREHGINNLIHKLLLGKGDLSQLTDEGAQEGKVTVLSEILQDLKSFLELSSGGFSHSVVLSICLIHHSCQCNNTLSD